MAIDWSTLNPFQATEADIINNKKAGMVYVADFPNGTGSIFRFRSMELLM